MEGDSAEGNDLCDAILRYINQALMEDNLEDKGSVIQDSTLHEVETSLYEVLNEKSLPVPDQHLSHKETSRKSDDSFTRILRRRRILSSEPSTRVLVPRLACQADWGWQANPSAGHAPRSGRDRNLPDCLQRGKKSLHPEKSDIDGKSHKHLASEVDESLLFELFDKVLCIYSGTNDSALNTVSFPNESNRESQQNEGAQESKIEMFYSRRGATKRQALVMRSLLLQCMQSVADNNKASASTLLKQIRLRSSPTGDGCQRLAHYFADGLEARLLGVGNPEHKAGSQRFFTDEETLKAYSMYLSALPFMDTAYFFTTQTIMELAEKATSIHIIQFGIVYGDQWSYLIHCLSRRPIGPPKLRITGIDLPQSGFRPDARVKETGWRLASYCKKLNVPFQYNGIAQKWETLSVEDLRIEKDEVLIVECLCQLMHLLDDTIMEHSPRDAVLNLIRIINPDVFVHGVSNGTYNSPFFTSRFREALFYFSSLFDMFDANLPRENPERMVFEREMWGKEIVNILASEGAERIERPETYKQWQNRMIRAGLRQLPLNREILKSVKAKVKSRYHKGFFVDESSGWLLEGWKGRVMFAFSCWKAA